MKNNFAALAVGILFSLGHGISGMTQPEKVFGFLDLLGNWTPSLIFVMIGAILVHFLAFRVISKRPFPLFSSQWYLPTETKITYPLVVGSVIFGMGWALGGYCPGPALTSLASFESRPAIFFASMIFGMLAFKVLNRKFNFKR